MEFDVWLAGKLGKTEVTTTGICMGRFIGEYLQEFEGISPDDWSFDSETQTLHVLQKPNYAEYIKKICDKYLINLVLEGEREIALDKQNIESRVVSHYLQSRDYNGLPLSDLADSLEVDTDEVLALAIQMVKASRIFIPSPHQTNPSVKLFEAPIGEQLLYINKRKPELICLYPTEASVRGAVNVSQYDDEPFTRLMVLVYPKLKPFPFQLDVLDTYQRDPRYDFYFYDFAGRIEVSENPPDQLQEQDIVDMRFGIGYGPQGEKMVVVYLHHLAALPGRHQRIWNEFLVDKPFNVAKDFIKTTIFAEFPEAISIYDAIIHEQVEINKLFGLLGRPQLFRKTFEGHRRPREFSLLIKPTQHNFDDFVLLLDQMLSDNIDKSAFGGDVCSQRRLERSNGEIELRPKSSLSLLEEWLSLRNSAQPNAKKSTLIKPLKEVRGLRNKAAHSIVEDKFDNQFYVLQNEVVWKVYWALHGIRCLLAEDHACSTYKPPFWDGKFQIKSY